MATYTDQAGHIIQQAGGVKRIISLAPSITELLFDMGMDEQILAVTNQCFYPVVRVQKKPKIGEFIHPDLEQIRSYNPQIIFVNQFLINKEVIRQLREEFTVWEVGVSSLEGALEQIRKIGEFVQKEPIANWIAEKITTRFNQLQEDKVAVSTSKRVLFATGNPDWKFAGHETLPHHLLERIGFSYQPTGEVSYQYFKDIASFEGIEPEIVFIPEHLMPEQTNFIHLLKTKFPSAEIRYVKSEYLEWQGSRLLRTPSYLRELAGRY